MSTLSGKYVILVLYPNMYIFQIDGIGIMSSETTKSFQMIEISDIPKV